MSIAVEKILCEVGAIIEGHFLLNSGLHSPFYVEKFRILQYPYYAQQLCSMIVQYYRDYHVDVVVGPATGGIIVAYEVARQLGVRTLFTEEIENLLHGKVVSRRTFRPGLGIESGEQVLLVDDILTMGGSIRETKELLEDMGGKVVGIGVLIDRSGRDLEFGVPLFSCHQISIPNYTPEECPLCAAHIPLVKPSATKKR